MNGHASNEQGPRWLARYLAGDHEGLWQELATLPAPPVGDGRTEAEAVATETMRRVRTNIDRLVPRWREATKSDPINDAPFHPPDPRRRSLLAAIESHTKRPVPLSIRAFYDEVGAVDLHGPNWFMVRNEGVGWVQRIDPLVIVPVMEARRETVIWRRWTTMDIPYAERDPVVGIYLSPAPYTKFEGAEEGNANEHPCMAFSTPGGVEAILRQGDSPEMMFVDYLHRSLRRGGLFAIGPDHWLDPAFEGGFGDVGASPFLVHGFDEIASGFTPF